MRVAILSESQADETALRILVDAILGIATTAPPALSLVSRGWSAVQANFPAVAKFLHYRTDAEGLVVVVDSNHTYLSTNEPKNRLRELQKLAQQCQGQFGAVADRIPLKIAVGVAAPAIEAWWLCKDHPHISEAAWEKGLNEKHDPYSKLELKRMLYGREYSSLEFLTQKMSEAARIVANDLPTLERNFPNGFSTLANMLRSWRRIT